jgi:hypothetical protein
MGVNTCAFETLQYIHKPKLRAFKNLSPVSNQHSARHCNRTILRVDSTRILVGSTRMRVQNLYFYYNIDIFSSFEIVLKKNKPMARQSLREVSL